MRLERIAIRNFRLLRRISIDLAAQGPTTVLVGPNNSGKTSVMDALRLLTGQGEGKRKFTAHDISHARRADFARIEEKLKVEADEEKQITLLRRFLPRIRMDLVFSYEDDPGDWVVASDLLMNLESANRVVAVRIEFAVEDAKRLLTEFRARTDQSESLFEFLSSTINRHYGLRYSKISERGDEIEPLENGRFVERLIRMDMIAAQRYMDDEESPRSAKLSKLLHDHYNTYYKVESADDASTIDALVKKIAKDLTEKYGGAFERLFKRLKGFGYPQGQSTPDLKIRAEMTADMIYRDNTFVYYGSESVSAEGESDVFDLPEKYNGLGYKNLIYIVLKLESFRAALEAVTVDRPRVHVIAIEEPEVHLHPQMQAVFIREIGKVLEEGTGPNAQVLLSTHSPHMVVDSGFDPIRYFKRSGLQVSVRDLSRLQPPPDDPDAIRFLKRYIKLTHCDLFFADKAILVEGQVEKILVPAMLQKCSSRPGLENLDRQYISILEVGGRHVHIFESLIEFIGIPTLAILDIDTVGTDGKKCPVEGAAKSSNTALTKWIPAKTNLAQLMSAQGDAKVKGKIRVAYQTTENGRCGRSFEEAFVYANLDWLTANHEKLLTTGDAVAEATAGDGLASNAYALGSKLPKVDFALDLINAEGWHVPAYIIDGVDWLGVQGNGA